jgi:hypothetical protein
MSTIRDSRVHAAIVNPPRPTERNPKPPADEFADRLEEVIKSMQDIPEDRKLRVYCQGKNGEDFRVGHIQISPSGLAIISGLDDAGNSVYSVSHFQRLQFICEISKVNTKENTKGKPIGFSR